MITIKEASHTVSGHRIELYNLYAGGGVPIHGAIEVGIEWIISCWYEDGTNYYSRDYDLDLSDDYDKNASKNWVENIPWQNLHPEIKAIVKDVDGWIGFETVHYSEKAEKYSFYSQRAWIIKGFRVPNSPYNKKYAWAIRPGFE